MGVPEERAKKLSFDRMIFKCEPTGLPDIEYRIDVTMREDSLEYDVIIKNAGASTYDISTGLLINLSDDAKAAGYKVSGTGYTDISDSEVKRYYHHSCGKIQRNFFLHESF